MDDIRNTSKYGNGTIDVRHQSTISIELHELI